MEKNSDKIEADSGPIPIPIPSPQIYDYGDTTIITQQITANVILLNGEGLSQLLQSLSDRIKALEPPVLPN